jgi:hypothetical protein
MDLRGNYHEETGPEDSDSSWSWESCIEELEEPVRHLDSASNLGARLPNVTSNVTPRLGALKFSSVKCMRKDTENQPMGLYLNKDVLAIHESKAAGAPRLFAKRFVTTSLSSPREPRRSTDVVGLHADSNDSKEAIINMQVNKSPFAQAAVMAARALGADRVWTVKSDAKPKIKLVKASSPDSKRTGEHSVSQSHAQSEARSRCQSMPSLMKTIPSVSTTRRMRPEEISVGFLNINKLVERDDEEEETEEASGGSSSFSSYSSYMSSITSANKL